MKFFVSALFGVMLLAGTTNAALIITDDGTTAPTGVVIQNAGNTSFTRVNDNAAQPTKARIRGQSFTTTNPIDVDAITLQLRGDNPGNSAPTTGSNPMRLRIWQLDPNSVAPSDGTSVLDDSGDFPLNMDGGDFFTLNLASTVSLNSGTEYGFSIEWVNASLGNDIFPTQLGGFSGGDLLFNTPAGTSEVNAANSTQDMTFFIQGTVVPEPASLLLMAFGMIVTPCVRNRRVA